jgi:rhombotail lipoprotein
MPMSMHRMAVALTPLSLLMLAACASGGATRRNASVVQYLYSKDVAPATATPTLRLPLTVGVAFVPDDVPGGAHAAPLSETTRVEVLRRVAGRFRARSFVRRIEVIPTAYLTPRGGFDNLDRLRAMFGVDVVVLVSYDQVQSESDRKLAVTYLTVAGAFLVHGQKNETRTMVDAAVFDVASRRLLFRAPGVSSLQSGAAAVESDGVQRRDADRGMRQAVEDMMKQLEVALDEFTQRVKDEPTSFSVVRGDADARATPPASQP